MKIRILQMLITFIALGCLLTSPGFADDEDPFARFIRPVSNPVYNLDARPQTFFRFLQGDASNLS